MAIVSFGHVNTTRNANGRLIDADTVMKFESIRIRNKENDMFACRVLLIWGKTHTYW